MRKASFFSSLFYGGSTGSVRRPPHGSHHVCLEERPMQMGALPRKRALSKALASSGFGVWIIFGLVALPAWGGTFDAFGPRQAERAWGEEWS